MSTAEGGQRGSLRPFFILWSGQAISLYGSAIVQFALIWWLTQETGSATILAAAALVGLLPQVLLGPFVGVLVDRWSRRWVMAAADSMIALATILLALLFWLEVVAVWHLFGLMFLRAVGGAFHHPAMQSSTALMVPHDQLTRIQGLNQMLEGSLNIISAPLGALVLSLLPMQECWPLMWLPLFLPLFRCCLLPCPSRRSRKRIGVRRGRPSGRKCASE